MLAKLSAFSWMMIDVLAPAEQVLCGERVGGRHQLGGAVLPHLQRREVTAGGMAAVAGHLEMRSGGVEVPGRAAGRGDRVGFALAHRVDVQAVEAGSQLTGGGGLHGDGRIAAGEIEVGGGDRGAVGEFELRGQLLACRFGFTLALTGGRRRRRRPGPDRRRGARLGRHRLVGAARAQGEGGHGEQGSDCDGSVRTRGAEEG